MRRLLIATALCLAPSTGAQELAPEETRGGRGLRVWHFPATKSEHFHLVLLVGVGSRHEPEQLAGICHLLEHAMQRGTTKRDTERLIEDLRAVGGRSDSLTTKEFTAFTVTVPRPRWATGVEWLTEIVTDPALLGSDIDRAKSIVTEELARGRHVRSPAADRALYGSHPLGRWAGGSIANVDAIQQPELRAFYEDHFVANNVIAAFAGAPDAKECVERIRESLAELRPGKVLTTSPPKPRTGKQATGSLDAGEFFAGHHIEPGGVDRLAHLLIARHALEELFEDEVALRRAISFDSRVDLITYRDTWRLDYHVVLSDRRKTGRLADAFFMVHTELARSAPNLFVRAKKHALGDLWIDSAATLLRNTELLRSVPSRDGALENLAAAIAHVDTGAFRKFARDEFTDDRRFLLTSSGRSATAIRWAWTLLLVLVSIATLEYLRRRRSQSAPARTPPATPGSRRAIDEVEREFQRYFEAEDRDDDGALGG